MAFALRRRVHYAYIQRWSGNPDSLALMVSTDRRVYFRFPDSTVDPVETALISREAAEAMRDEIVAFLVTKPGRQLVRDARGATTATINVHGETVRATPQPHPSGGGGFPHFADPPSKLHAGEYPAWLSSRFTRYLDLRPKYEATLARLAERNPQHYQVYIEHVHGGRRLTEIAASLGITPANARVQHHRARVFLRKELPRDV